MRGGSSLGYKLAGFDVIGCNEIDKRMMDCYIKNNNPKYSFLEPIQSFKLKNDLPEDLYNLDILDGSPPCSTFSMAGNREENWGKEKMFREGQQEQVLDTLFFDFIDVAKKLQPKIVISENVKGLLLGSAFKYVQKIYKCFDEAGYITKHFLLDASKMGVPQKRERVFFISVRKDLAKNFLERISFFEDTLKLDLYFNEKEIPIAEFVKGMEKKKTQNYSETRYGDVICNIYKPAPTITTDINRYWLDENNLIDIESIKLIGSFPLDYDFLENNPQYIIGMSVPPIMMKKIAEEVYNKILNNL